MVSKLRPDVLKTLLPEIRTRFPLLDRLRPYRVETNRNEPPWKYEQGMLNHAVQVADGNHYHSAAVYRHLGKPALCRASFAHYDTAETVDRFLEALADVMGARP